MRSAGAGFCHRQGGVGRRGWWGRGVGRWRCGSASLLFLPSGAGRGPSGRLSSLRSFSFASASRHKARRAFALAALRAGASPHSTMVAPRPPLAPPVNGRGIGRASPLPLAGSRRRGAATAVGGGHFSFSYSPALCNLPARHDKARPLPCPAAARHSARQQAQASAAGDLAGGLRGNAHSGG